LKGDNAGNAIQSSIVDNGSFVLTQEPLLSGTPAATPTGITAYMGVSDSGTVGGLIFQQALGNGTDAKIWDSFIASNSLDFRAVNDAYSAATNWLSVTRSGTAISSIVFPTLTDSALTSGNCVQASTGGLLTTVGLPCIATFTTTGTSGAATFSGGVLNIPNYSTGSGTVTTSGTPTTGFISLFTGSTVIGNSHLDDGITNSGAITSSEPVVVTGGFGIQLSVSTFASLPTCNSGAEGTTAGVNDSTTNTWGATITGSGTNHVLAYCDGTQYTVAAK
jgi:hypothetical protein